MDDDLLADDGQFKDDGSDELDIDEEAALLGLSDEEIEKDAADQELEYVDEDGNPVEIGENNAELYEVANVSSEKLRTPPEEDILELDLDVEIESFTQENPDLITRESPVKTFNERQCKENLISLTSRTEREKPPPRRKESLHSPVTITERSTSELSYMSHSQSSRQIVVDSYSDAAEYDEESEDESVADDHRERFKSERSNIITLTPAKKRADIPDTLESVISVEETAKVQAFLENEQKRKMRFKGKGPMRMKNAGRFSRGDQSFSNMQSQHHHQNQFSSQSQGQLYQSPPTQAQSRKILINPHFRGVRLPPAATSEQVIPVNPAPQVSVPPVSYEAPQTFVPPPYSHHDNSHQVNMSAPVFSAPPPAIPYKPPAYSILPSPQQHIQQAPPPIWQQPPPEIPPPVSYANPPPSLNYGDPLAQVPGYHNNYNPNNFQNTSYSAPQIPPPQTINYSQPPPPVPMHPPSYPPPPATSAQTNVTHMHFQTSHPRQQQHAIQKPYHEHKSVNQSQVSHNQRKNLSQPQRFARPPEKRTSNVNIKQVPIKQARMEHQTRKNVHVNNSNIKEIPLVDNLPTAPKTAVKIVPIVEEEDEKTKELRMKIEEQKLLREQILKRKEERRRQMAAQRLMDLKKRQAEQNKNVIAIQRVEQVVPVKVPVVQAVSKAKVSVKERIGMPMTNTATPVKKKIVVVRKKVAQPPNNVVPNEQKKPLAVTQRFGTQVTRLPQKMQASKTAENNTPVNQNQSIKPKPLVTPNEQKPVVSLPNKNTSPANKPSPPAKKQVVTKTNVNPTAKHVNKPFLNKKSNILQRLGNRGNLQRQFQPRPPTPRLGPPSPRFQGPRPPQFQNPRFMEHRMRPQPPGPPMNDMRMQGPPFHDPRPPLLPFHSRGERAPFMFENNHPRFRMQGPGFQNFRPMGMDLFHDRFPPPRFPPNQMAPMRQFEPNGQMFHGPRQRFQGPNMRQKSGMTPKQQKPANAIRSPVSKAPPSNESATGGAGKPSAKTVLVPGTKDADKQTKPQNQQVQNTSNNSNSSASHSVSVENLSSSTSEIQLKKLCSAVGVVDTIQLMKDSRKAIIRFKDPSQAVSFQKKYQRYMLDLAMIQVSLLPT